MGGLYNADPVGLFRLAISFGVIFLEVMLFQALFKFT